MARRIKPTLMWFKRDRNILIHVKEELGVCQTSGLDDTEIQRKH